MIYLRKQSYLTQKIYHLWLTFYSLKPGYSRTRSEAWLMIPKHLCSADCLPQHYWPCRINWSSSSMHNLQNVAKCFPITHICFDFFPHMYILLIWGNACSQPGLLIINWAWWMLCLYHTVHISQGSIGHFQWCHLFDKRLYLWMTTMWPLSLTWITIILVWISNYIRHKDWGEIIYPLPNAYSKTVEVSDSSHNLLGIWLLTHAGNEVKSCC